MVDAAKVTVIITGANGWLGRATTARFATSSNVVAVVRDRAEGHAIEPFLATIGGTVELEFADLTDPRNVDAILARHSEPVQLVHTAGVIHPHRFADFDAVNAVGTAHLSRAARSANVTRFVHISSTSPFGANTSTTDFFRQNEPYRPYLGYGASKMRGELAVLDEVSHGLNAVIIRAPWFYGPHQPARQSVFLSMIKAGRFPILKPGQQRRSLVYIENLVDSIEAALRWDGPPGRAWWVADARSYTMVEIVETVSRALADEGHHVKLNNLHLPAFMGRAAEQVDRALQRLHCYNQRVHVLGELGKTIVCDISTSALELGWQPQIDLYEGMRRSIRWCRENGVHL